MVGNQLSVSLNLIRPSEGRREKIPIYFRCRHAINFRIDSFIFVIQKSIRLNATFVYEFKLIIIVLKMKRNQKEKKSTRRQDYGEQKTHAILQMHQS